MLSLNSVNRYKYIQSFSEIDNKVSIKETKLKTTSKVPVEYYDHVVEVQPPDWMGNKINILV